MSGRSPMQDLWILLCPHVAGHPLPDSLKVEEKWLFQRGCPGIHSFSPFGSCDPPPLPQNSVYPSNLLVHNQVETNVGAQYLEDDGIWRLEGTACVNQKYYRVVSKSLRFPALLCSPSLGFESNVFEGRHGRPVFLCE